MLGIIRFFLASCVIVFHLSLQVPHIGLLAVNFFYVISGYLITMILNDSYRFNFKSFALNRFLRLYPTYFFFSAISIVFSVTYISGHTSSPFHPSWSGHYQPFDLIANIFLFPWEILNDYGILSFFSNPYVPSEAARFRWIPSSWSVAVEIICYVILWAFTARNFFSALITLAAAIVINALVGHFNLNPLYRYSPFFAAMLPFSLGALSYFLVKANDHRKHLFEILDRYQLVTLIFIVALFTVNWYFASKQWGVALFSSIAYYTNNLIACLAVIIFHKTQPKGFYDKICKFIGDLSYPIFISQYLGGYIAWIMLGSPIQNRGWEVFFYGYAVTLAMSILSVLIIDGPIKKVRNIIRPKTVVP
ncbi:acyltransferase [Pantoea sp. ICBG 985]|uniref:acyltransferase family protein n=1 Tax=Pantoea sp. ICBG 985 TaxID=2071683 RepID=UPI000CE462FB|nr:acyltransferase [Pantoea sp. ICBG 985]PPC72695.1 acyltransferase [Pantoea sp. ICBG 985]